jgi:hypothetical protein
VITLYHEPFQQLQEFKPGHQARVNALGLARGDQTGMWIVNYPFPYTVAKVKHHFSTMANVLGEALGTKRPADFAARLAASVQPREKFRSLLKADDSKYFAFQVWKEGIARYRAYRLAELAAAEYKPSKEFQKLKDYRSFQEVSRAIRSAMEKELRSVQLDKAKRTVVYNFGAAEALLLDRAHPSWRERYFESPLSLDKHFRARE